MKVLIIAEDPGTKAEICPAFQVDWPEAGLGEVELVVISRGEEGAAAVRSQSPDILIIDWALPGINGLYALVQIRRFSNVPVILLFSKRSDATQLVEALEYGADAYMLKPVRRMELLARVQALTRRRKALARGPAQMKILRSSLATQ